LKTCDFDNDTLTFKCYRTVDTCDGYVDCYDGKDEEGCNMDSNPPIDIDNVTCTDKEYYNQFVCDNLNTCLPFEAKCNGKQTLTIYESQLCTFAFLFELQALLSVTMAQMNANARSAIQQLNIIVEMAFVLTQNTSAIMSSIVRIG
jgi:hypothetical protein